MQILGISGSLRRDSCNTKLLRAAGELMLDDVEFVIWDGLRAVPPYDEDADRDPAPAGVARLRDALAGADAVLFATPEYNSSIPGQLKNAIDWASRPIATNVLRNKPVAVIGASTGMFGAVWAQAELRKVLAATERESSRARYLSDKRTPASTRPAGWWTMPSAASSPRSSTTSSANPCLYPSRRNRHDAARPGSTARAARPRGHGLR